MAIGKFHGVMMPTTPIGLARHLDADARAHRRHDLARQAQRLAGEELEDLSGAGDFADALGEGLALFAAQQLAELRPCGRRSRGRSSLRISQRSRMPERDQAGNAALAAAMASSVSC